MSFPVQTLVKSGKMIPVMIWGTLMMNKKYKIIDYTVAVIVMIGCSIFLLTGQVSVKQTSSRLAGAIDR